MKLRPKTFKSIRKTVWKTRKRIRKAIRNAFETISAPLKPLKNISPALFKTCLKVFHRPKFPQKKLFFTARLCRGSHTNEITGKCQTSPCENPAMLACNAKIGMLGSSDAKCLQFGLPLRFGLRCERPRCQIASDVGRAMRATKDNNKKSKNNPLNPETKQQQNNSVNNTLRFFYIT